MARPFKAVLASTILVLGFSAPLLAGPFEDGVSAYDRADYSGAMRYWRPLAEQGNPAAQSNLALMYAKGQSVPKDYVQAYMWSSLAASAGHQEGVTNRNSIAKGMSPAEIADAQKRVSAWKPVNPPAAPATTTASSASAPAPTAARPVSSAPAPAPVSAQPSRSTYTTSPTTTYTTSPTTTYSSSSTIRR